MEEHVHCPLCGREAMRLYSQRWECQGCGAVGWPRSVGELFQVINCGAIIWRDSNGGLVVGRDDGWNSNEKR